MLYGQLACTYVSLVLCDDGIRINAEKIAALMKAAGLTVDSYWPSLFAKLAEKKNLNDLITNVVRWLWCTSCCRCCRPYWWCCRCCPCLRREKVMFVLCPIDDASVCRNWKKQRKIVMTTWDSACLTRNSTQLFFFL